MLMMQSFHSCVKEQAAMTLQATDKQPCILPKISRVQLAIDELICGMFKMRLSTVGLQPGII